MLLAGSGCVKLAAHFREAPVDVVTEVAEVVAQRVETCSGRVSEVADLGSDRSDVAVGRAGQHPGSCGVLLGCAESPLDALDGCLQRVHTPFEILLTHNVETTGVMSSGVSLVSGSVD